VTLFHEPAPRRPGKPETRRRIAECAAVLFAEQGYASTSLEAIASAAAVHVQTIFHTYGSKVAVLEAAARVAVAGADDFEGLGRDWQWVQDLRSDTDGEGQLRRFAAHTRDLAARAGPLTAEIRSAARSDPDVARFLVLQQASRRRGPAGVVDRLIDLGVLRRDLDRERATATLLGISGYDSYDALVCDCGWSPEDYETWLGDLFCQLLLEPPDANPDAESHTP